MIAVHGRRTGNRTVPTGKAVSKIYRKEVDKMKQSNMEVRFKSRKGAGTL